jgi:hypothetical protein
LQIEAGPSELSRVGGAVLDNDEDDDLNALFQAHARKLQDEAGDSGSESDGWNSHKIVRKRVKAKPKKKKSKLKQKRVKDAQFSGSDNDDDDDSVPGGAPVPEGFRKALADEVLELQREADSLKARSEKSREDVEVEDNEDWIEGDLNDEEQRQYRDWNDEEEDDEGDLPPTTQAGSSSRKQASANRLHKKTEELNRQADRELVSQWLEREGDVDVSAEDRTRVLSDLLGDLDSGAAVPSARVALRGRRGGSTRVQDRAGVFHPVVADLVQRGTGLAPMDEDSRKHHVAQLRSSLHESSRGAFPQVATLARALSASSSSPRDESNRQELRVAEAFALRVAASLRQPEKEAVGLTITNSSTDGLTRSPPRNRLAMHSSSRGSLRTGLFSTQRRLDSQALAKSMGFRGAKELALFRERQVKRAAEREEQARKRREELRAAREAEERAAREKDERIAREAMKNTFANDSEDEELPPTAQGHASDDEDVPTQRVAVEGSSSAREHAFGATAASSSGALEQAFGATAASSSGALEQAFGATAVTYARRPKSDSSGAAAASFSHPQENSASPLREAQQQDASEADQSASDDEEEGLETQPQQGESDSDVEETEERPIERESAHREKSGKGNDSSYAAMIRKEILEERKRRRVASRPGEQLVEEEAEEDDEDEAANAGLLIGQFGNVDMKDEKGNPLTVEEFFRRRRLQEEQREAAEVAEMEKHLEEELKHVVDDLSDGEEDGMDMNFLQQQRAKREAAELRAIARAQTEGYASLRRRDDVVGTAMRENEEAEEEAEDVDEEGFMAMKEAERRRRAETTGDLMAQRTEEDDDLFAMEEDEGGQAARRTNHSDDDGDAVEDVETLLARGIEAQRHRYERAARERRVQAARREREAQRKAEEAADALLSPEERRAKQLSRKLREMAGSGRRRGRRDAARAVLASHAADFVMSSTASFHTTAGNAPPGSSATEEDTELMRLVEQTRSKPKAENPHPAVPQAGLLRRAASELAEAQLRKEEEAVRKRLLERANSAVSAEIAKKQQHREEATVSSSVVEAPPREPLVSVQPQPAKKAVGFMDTWAQRAPKRAREESPEPVDEPPTLPVDEPPTLPVDEPPTLPVDEPPTLPVDQDNGRDTPASSDSDSEGESEGAIQYDDDDDLDIAAIRAANGLSRARYERGSKSAAVSRAARNRAAVGNAVETSGAPSSMSSALRAVTGPKRAKLDQPTTEGAVPAFGGSDVAAMVAAALPELGSFSTGGAIANSASALGFGHSASLMLRRHSSASTHGSNSLFRTNPPPSDSSNSRMERPSAPKLMRQASKGFVFGTGRTRDGLVESSHPMESSYPMESSHPMEASVSGSAKRKQTTPTKGPSKLFAALASSRRR